MDNLLAMAGPDTFAQDVADVIAWVLGEPLAEDHPFSGVRAQPLGPTGPQPWLLSSTNYTAGLAAHLGLPYCFAHFFNDGAGAAEALALYRASFRPSRQSPLPLTSLGVWAVAAATEEEAEALFLPYAYWRLDRDRGRVTPFPGPKEIAACSHAAREREKIERLRQRVGYGTADTVAARLHALADGLRADGLVIVTMTHDLVDRIRSYELIAAAMGATSTGAGRSGPSNYQPDSRLSEMAAAQKRR